VPHNLKFGAVVVLLATAALFLQTRDRSEIRPPREKFSSLPYAIGSWTGSDTSIPPDTLKVLGQGDFVSRNYMDDSRTANAIQLFMAYFPSQRFGDTIHSPKNCLPGAGWTPVKSSKIEIAIPGQEPILANRYVVAKGDERMLVLYWYFAHGRSVASEYRAKLYLVQDALRLRRTDGSLIRLATPIRQNERSADAQRRSTDFLAQLLPLLGAYIPH